jgi:hypothetical protein
MVIYTGKTRAGRLKGCLAAFNGNGCYRQSDSSGNSKSILFIAFLYSGNFLNKINAAPEYNYVAANDPPTQILQRGLTARSTMLVRKEGGKGRNGCSRERARLWPLVKYSA